MNVFFVAFNILFIFAFIPSGILQLVSSDQTCVAQGTFEINDGTCQSYYLCIFDGATFASYQFKCTGTTVFNPSLKYCTPSSDYVCTQIKTEIDPVTTATAATPTTAPAATPTTAPTTTITAPTTTAIAPAPTTAAPTITTTIAPAPTTTAPTTITTTVPTTTTTAPTTTTTQAPCIAKGRFEIKEPTCQTYYFCYLMGSTYIRYELKCPSILRFDPSTQLCVLPALRPCLSS